MADFSQSHHWHPHEMTCEQQLKRFHTDDIDFSDLGIAPDWLKQISLATGPIRSITQNLVVT